MRNDGFVRFSFVSRDPMRPATGRWCTGSQLIGMVFGWLVLITYDYRPTLWLLSRHPVPYDVGLYNVGLVVFLLASGNS